MPVTRSSIVDFLFEKPDLPSLHHELQSFQMQQSAYFTGSLRKEFYVKIAVKYFKSQPSWYVPVLLKMLVLLTKIRSPHLLIFAVFKFEVFTKLLTSSYYCTSLQGPVNIL